MCIRDSFNGRSDNTDVIHLQANEIMHWISKQFSRAIDKTSEIQMEWCVTLESNSNSEFYIQFTAEHINLAYPRSEDPNGLLEELPTFPGRRIATSKSGMYLTLEHGIEQAIEPVGVFVENYISAVFGLPTNESEWSITEQII